MMIMMMMMMMLIYTFRHLLHDPTILHSGETYPAISFTWCKALWVHGSIFTLLAMLTLQWHAKRVVNANV